MLLALQKVLLNPDLAVEHALESNLTKVLARCVHLQVLAHTNHHVLRHIKSEIQAAVHLHQAQRINQTPHPRPPLLGCQVYQLY